MDRHHYPRPVFQYQCRDSRDADFAHNGTLSLGAASFLQRHAGLVCGCRYLRAQLDKLRHPADRSHRWLALSHSCGGTGADGGVRSGIRAIEQAGKAAHSDDLLILASMNVRGRPARYLTEGKLDSQRELRVFAFSSSRASQAVRSPSSLATSRATSSQRSLSCAFPNMLCSFRAARACAIAAIDGAL